jgi:hypothetical protein
VVGHAEHAPIANPSTRAPTPPIEQLHLIRYHIYTLVNKLSSDRIYLTVLPGSSFVYRRFASGRYHPGRSGRWCLRDPYHVARGIAERAAGPKLEVRSRGQLARSVRAPRDISGTARFGSGDYAYAVRLTARSHA